MWRSLHISEHICELRQNSLPLWYIVVSLSFDRYTNCKSLWNNTSVKWPRGKCNHINPGIEHLCVFAPHVGPISTTSSQFCMLSRSPSVGPTLQQQRLWEGGGGSRPLTRSCDPVRPGKLYPGTEERSSRAKRPACSLCSLDRGPLSGLPHSQHGTGGPGVDDQGCPDPSALATPRILTFAI